MEARNTACFRMKEKHDAGGGRVEEREDLHASATGDAPQAVITSSGGGVALDNSDDVNNNPASPAGADAQLPLQVGVGHCELRFCTYCCALRAQDILGSTYRMFSCITLRVSGFWSHLSRFYKTQNISSQKKAYVARICKKTVFAS